MARTLFMHCSFSLFSLVIIYFLGISLSSNFVYFMRLILLINLSIILCVSSVMSMFSVGLVSVSSGEISSLWVISATGDGVLGGPSTSSLIFPILALVSLFSTWRHWLLSIIGVMLVQVFGSNFFQILHVPLVLTYFH